MRYVLAMVLVLGLAGGVMAADLVSGVCEPEIAGPRKGECRSFGWQERERGSDDSLIQSPGDAGASGGDAGGDAGGADGGASSSQ